ncbi:MAG: hypothetical protein HY554_09290 [Elusimicrobia bacterium]|nr:hypothetical protein [Elusimicrobiota bacterium]
MPPRALAEPVIAMLDRSLVLLILTGMLCLGVALGLELFPQFVARAAAPIRLEAADKVPVFGSAPREPQGRKALSCKELFQILTPRRADPAGARFAADFMAREPLRRLHQEFSSGDGARPAAQLIGALQRSKEFGELVRAHAKDEAFRGVAEVVTRHPELSRLLRGMAAARVAVAPPPPSAPNQTADPVGAERRGRASPISGVRAPGRPVSGRER